jgi:hypothetical protein
LTSKHECHYGEEGLGREHRNVIYNEGKRRPAT